MGHSRDSVKKELMVPLIGKVYQEFQSQDFGHNSIALVSIIAEQSIQGCFTGFLVPSYLQLYKMQVYVQLIVSISICFVFWLLVLVEIMNSRQKAPRRSTDRAMNSISVLTSPLSSLLTPTHQVHLIPSLDFKPRFQTSFSSLGRSFLSPTNQQSNSAQLFYQINPIFIMQLSFLTLIAVAVTAVVANPAPVPQTPCDSIQTSNCQYIYVCCFPPVEIKRGRRWGKGEAIAC